MSKLNIDKFVNISSYEQYHFLKFFVLTQSTKNSKLFGFSIKDSKPWYFVEPVTTLELILLKDNIVLTMLYKGSDVISSKCNIFSNFFVSLVFCITF